MNVPTKEIEEGKIASFQCVKKDNNDPVVVRRWLYNEGLLPEDDSITTANRPYYNYLLIDPTHRRHSGVYTCEAEDAGTLFNVSEKLYVACPIVAFKQPVISAVLGENTTLRCDGECYRYIFWGKNDYIVTTLEPHRFSSPGNGSILRITNVSLSDNGTFSCQLISKNTVHSSAELLVLVPTDRVTINSSGVAKIGYQFKVQCQSNGIPLPKSVSWFNNSSPIHSTSRIRTEYDKTTGIAILTINEITRYNFSTIRCLFKQDLLPGQYHYATAITTILPTGKPDPPTHLTMYLHIASTLTFHVSWEAPAFTGHSHVLAYRITYWDENGCREKPLTCFRGEVWLDDSVRNHQFELQGYGNHTRLCIYVQSVNTDGLSLPSEISCTGVKRVPPAPPTRAQPPTTGADVNVHIPVTTTEFQVILKNRDGICSGVAKVGKENLTRALASHFNWLCSCDVPHIAVTADSYVQLGGVVYYRGFIRCVHAEGLVTRLSRYVENGQGQLRLLDTFLVFLASCPVRVTDGICQVSIEDSSNLHCSHSSTEAIASEVPDRTSWPLLSIIVAAGLGGLVMLLSVLSLVFCARQGCQQKRDEKRDKRGKISVSTLTQTDSQKEIGGHRLLSSSSSDTISTEHGLQTK
jgi:hypothetical protein